MPIQHPSLSSSNLLEVLEKILDKGVVIAGDIKISLADVDLLTIKIRLLCRLGKWSRHFLFYCNFLVCEVIKNESSVSGC
ncbi:gas vesicle protein [Bacillus sp. ISL-75]|nr:gas vesicle protein [Bacillus sp. ISL-75]